MKIDLLVECYTEGPYEQVIPPYPRWVLGGGGNVEITPCRRPIKKEIDVPVFVIMADEFFIEVLGRGGKVLARSEKTFPRITDVFTSKQGIAFDPINVPVIESGVCETFVIYRGGEVFYRGTCGIVAHVLIMPNTYLSKGATLTIQAMSFR